MHIIGICELYAQLLVAVRNRTLAFIWINKRLSIVFRASRWRVNGHWLNVKLSNFKQDVSRVATICLSSGIGRIVTWRVSVGVAWSKRESHTNGWGFDDLPPARPPSSAPQEPLRVRKEDGTFAARSSITTSRSMWWNYRVIFLSFDTTPLLATLGERFLERRCADGSGWCIGWSSLFVASYVWRGSSHVAELKSLGEVWVGC